MIKYNFLYKQSSKPEKLIIEADNLEEAEAISREFCEIFGFNWINVSPTVFDIRRYIKDANGGENIMPHPHIYGRMLEQQRLRQEKKAESAIELQLNSAPAKVTK
jgi:hypothetical protein